MLRRKIQQNLIIITDSNFVFKHKMKRIVNKDTLVGKTKSDGPFILRWTQNSSLCKMDPKGPSHSTAEKLFTACYVLQCFLMEDLYVFMKDKGAKPCHNQSHLRFRPRLLA